MRKVIHTVKWNVVLLLVGALLGFLALLLVHLLPTEPMARNVRWSMGMLEKEFADSLVIDGYEATLTGSFTDSLMLEHAVYDTSRHGVVEQVLHMYRTESYNDVNNPDGWWPGQSLKDYLENTTQTREVEYGRYWHGYLVILKPLLMFTTVSNIRLISAGLSLVLIGLVLIAMMKREGGGTDSLAKAFILSMPFLFFFSTFASLSLSICMYIMLFTLLVQLKLDTALQRKGWYGLFFLLIGMVTAYFDFLTYPLVTLGYPLCVYLYFHGDVWLKNFKKMIFYSVEWSVGYLGMWMEKWMLADLLTDSRIIQNALATILTRTGSVEGVSGVESFLQALSVNMGVYANWSFVLIAMVALFFAGKALRGAGLCKLKQRISGRSAFFLLALYPFGWYLVTRNHSVEHWQFTCRILAVAVFAGITGVLSILQQENLDE